MIEKLGKTPPRLDSRTLMLAPYLGAALPAPPPHLSYVEKVKDWEMLGNDTAGDCVLAGGAHAIKQWTAYASAQFNPTAAEVIAAYSEFTGYDPSDPSTDQGTNELDFLKAWRKRGFWGHKIEAFAALQPRSDTELKDSIWLFGNAFLGLALPKSIESQGDVWTVADGPDGEPGSLGGHCTLAVGYSVGGVLMVTWGKIQRATWGWMNKYTDESYAIVSRDWIRANGISPSGFHLASLEADLRKVTHA